MRTIFITGASSKIGQLLVDALIGKAHLILLQNERPLSWPEGECLKVLTGGLKACPGYEDELGQVDVIIHLAAITHTDHTDSYYQVNHQGTSKLLSAAHNSQHFIYISTRCVGEAGGGYSHSKLLAEQAVQDSGIP